MRQQTNNGAGRNALLDSPAHAKYNDFRHVFAWFDGHGPMQVPRRTKERRLVFANIDSEFNSHAVIGFEAAVSKTTNVRSRKSDLIRIRAVCPYKPLLGKWER